jgi:hypothetical protein
MSEINTLCGVRVQQWSGMGGICFGDLVGFSPNEQCMGGVYSRRTAGRTVSTGCNVSIVCRYAAIGMQCCLVCVYQWLTNSQSSTGT